MAEKKNTKLENNKTYSYNGFSSINIYIDSIKFFVVQGISFTYKETKKGSFIFGSFSLKEETKIKLKNGKIYFKTFNEETKKVYSASINFLTSKIEDNNYFFVGIPSLENNIFWKEKSIAKENSKKN